MTDKEFIRKFDSGENFNEQEIKDMCWGDVGECIEQRTTEEGYLYSEVDTIFEVDNRFFKISWLEGTAECQINVYNDKRPQEVRMIKKVVYDYVPC